MATDEPVDGASAGLTLECPRIPLSSLSAAELRRRFMIPNLPVLLTDATDAWRAQHEWVTPEGRPDLPALARLFGDSIVPVADCARGGRRTEMSLGEYAAWWTGDRAPDACLYLKDWTFAAEHPSYDAYETPAILRDDWLNEHWNASQGGGGSGGTGSSLEGQATESILDSGVPAPGMDEGDSEAGDEAGDHRCAAQSGPRIASSRLPFIPPRACFRHSRPPAAASSPRPHPHLPLLRSFPLPLLSPSPTPTPLDPPFHLLSTFV
jgi:hypothetical protein